MTDLSQRTALEHLEQFYEREQERNVDEALRGIERARKELDRIEEQLKLAANGEPYLRIGEVRGADAGAIFAAFGTIENLAQLRKSREQEE